MTRHTTARSLLWAGALACSLALSACTGNTDGGPAPSATSTAPSVPNDSQLAGVEVYTDPAGHVPLAITAATAEGREGDVEVLEALDQPTATWFSGQQEDPGAVAQKITTDAQAEGLTPVLVLYNVPGRDCGLYSGGGADDAEAYKAWVGSIGAGIGDRPAIIILEPDAIPQTVVGCESIPDPAARLQLLSESVDILAKQSGTRVYLDAGNAGWIEDLDALAAALEAAGLSRSAGFSLNVSNFETTQASAEYGQRLSDAAGGGPAPLRPVSMTKRAPPEDGTEYSWCNPSGRLLGEPPTTDPGIERVDALLWIKQPGDSDGDCRAGEPTAGQFSLDLARDLAG